MKPLALYYSYFIPIHLTTLNLVRCHWKERTETAGDLTQRKRNPKIPKNLVRSFAAHLSLQLPRSVGSDRIQRPDASPRLRQWTLRNTPKGLVSFGSCFQFWDLNTSASFLFFYSFWTWNASQRITRRNITYSRVHPLIYEHLITPFDLGAQWLAPIYERIFGALIEIYAPGPNGTHTILKRPEKERHCRHRWTKISPINIWRLNLP